MSIPSNQSQSDRFKEAARALECDDDEVHFNAKLKKVAKAKEAAASATRRDGEN